MVIKLSTVVPWKISVLTKIRIFRKKTSFLDDDDPSTRGMPKLECFDFKL